MLNAIPSHGHAHIPVYFDTHVRVVSYFISVYSSNDHGSVCITRDNKIHLIVINSISLLGQPVLTNWIGSYPKM